MEQKILSIYSFKKGDKITRIKPSKSIMKFGDENVVDRNYIGSPFIFVGIANGCIYLRRDLNSSSKQLMNEMLSMFNIDMDKIKQPMINLELDLFENDWTYWIDPDNIEDNNNLTLKELEEKKEKALNEENYEEVARISKQIKNIK